VGAKAETTTVRRLTRGGASVARLQAEVRALEREVERLEDQLANEEFYVLDGYVVALSPVGDGTLIASCPTLHASVQEPGRDAALASLREAVDVAKSAHELAGRPLPPKDVLARYLD